MSHKINQLSFKDFESREAQIEQWNQELLDCRFSYPLPVFRWPPQATERGCFPRYQRLPKVCVDIGANVGAFSYYAAPYFKNIYAFEPVSKTAAVATTNLKEDTHVHIYNLAVGSTDGATVDLTSDTTNLSRDASSFHDITGPVENCKTISLEGIYELCGFDYIDYLKVDCEGAEYDFLYDKDLSKINFLSIEVHPGFIGRKKTTELMKHIDQFFGPLLTLGDHIGVYQTRLQGETNERK